MNMYEGLNIPWDAVEKSDDFRAIFYTYDELMSPLSPNGPKVVIWPQCRQVIINVKIETD